MGYKAMEGVNSIEWEEEVRVTGCLPAKIGYFIQDDYFLSVEKYIDEDSATVKNLGKDLPRSIVDNYFTGGSLAVLSLHDLDELILAIKEIGKDEQ